MAVYKVAQDVEADDKLIGPFSFRQFIYLMIAAGAGFLAFGLSRIMMPLLIIPLPIVIFFGALALPLRRDQPTEVYFAAILSFYLKPRRRLWVPDGIEELIEITVPKEVEVQRAKDITTDEATRRLSYLANIADTGGWSIRNVDAADSSSPMQTDVFNEAINTVDVLDTSGAIGQAFDEKIVQADARRREEMVQRMQNPVATPAPTPVADEFTAALSQPTPSGPVDSSSTPTPVYNPYPTSIRQTVIQPLSEQVATPAAPEPVAPTTTAPATTSTDDNDDSSTSETTVSPDIINLANNPDLSIETIAREAHRIQEKKEEDEGKEVYVSLR